MKYDKLRKLDRNKELIDYCRRNPGASLEEVGAVFNISASRVCRIKKGEQHGNRTRDTTGRPD